MVRIEGGRHPRHPHRPAGRYRTHRPAGRPRRGPEPSGRGSGGRDEYGRPTDSPDGSRGRPRPADCPSTGVSSRQTTINAWNDVVGAYPATPGSADLTLGPYPGCPGPSERGQGSKPDLGSFVEQAWMLDTIYLPLNPPQFFKLGLFSPPSRFCQEDTSFFGQSRHGLRKKPIPGCGHGAEVARRAHQDQAENNLPIVGPGPRRKSLSRPSAWASVSRSRPSAWASVSRSRPRQDQRSPGRVGPDRVGPVGETCGRARRRGRRPAPEAVPAGLDGGTRVGVRRAPYEDFHTRPHPIATRTDHDPDRPARP